MVGAAGFEPAALCSQSRCATRLRYAPTREDRIINILTLSFVAIAISWGYTLWAAFASPFAAPEHFSTLVAEIAVRKAIVLGVILVLLRSGGESLRSLGFRPARSMPDIVRGAGYGAVVFVVLNVGLSSILGSLMPSDHAGVAGSLTAFFRDPAHLLVWIPVGVVAGGLVEEIERAFVLTRFERWAGRPGLYAGLAFGSAMFGVAHLYQSRSSAISAAVSGLAFGLVYLRRRSGLEAAACHAFADVLGVVVATMLAR
jgi:membrane protease YdiL (CAAX protease family)